MPSPEFLSSPAFTWVVLPTLIFLARISDVSIGTVRLIFVARGLRWYAAMLAFFEVLIWLTAIGQIMKNLTNPACYLAYSGGYAMGTFAGMWLENRLSLGKVIVRVITDSDATGLVHHLRGRNCPTTSSNAEVESRPAKIIFSVVRRQDLAAVIAQIQRLTPTAFYSVEDVRYASDTGFHLMPRPESRNAA
jgi:uncharacterized protein YebE (UPF0316 family)